MKPINEKELENVCGGQEIRKTLSTVGLALMMCSLFAVTSAILVHDIKKVNSELKQYPEVNNTDKFYTVKHIIVEKG